MSSPLDGGTAHLWATDLAGSVTVMRDASGAVTGQYGYTVFGARALTAGVAVAEAAGVAVAVVPMAPVIRPALSRMEKIVRTPLARGADDVLHQARAEASAAYLAPSAAGVGFDLLKGACK